MSPHTDEGQIARAPFRPLPFELKTQRLILRLWDRADASGYRELVGERGDPLPTMDEALADIDGARESAPGRGIHLLTLRRRDDPSMFLGYCGLVIGRASIEEPEIAYELLRSAHGNGYATEAAQVIVDAARATGRTRLWSTVRPWNPPSFRVLEKIGFSRDRVTTDDGGDIVWLTRSLDA
ncbi:GNAT family N-acetyltransferase [Mycetocola zhadangensis]|uniref:N-acetyltransferase n=1 Tax=Mycetocola zhadangensis TaxID=1164595 RepID=A0A3L7J6U9_9MICO|nr:GNAT family N-acetyltransferase [Mycetocola zhadangensis]RLQ86346.1 N-acetyltransferase [Mycetocola zhadangensis]GGE90389.1 N-acetyltransferase [Mycetocola zhadangensis]